MNLNAALKWLSAVVVNNIGYSLREPELVILKGTWRGLTYEQMASSSDYSTNYLMRDVAPKLWKHLSNVFGRSVGKTNFRVALEAYASTTVRNGPELVDDGFGLADDTAPFARAFGRDSVSGVRPSLASGLYQQPSVLSSVLLGASASAERSDNHSGARNSTTMTSTKMYGYKDELARVKQWAAAALVPSQTNDGEQRVGGATGQLIGIWGLRGVGKTLLLEKLAAQIGDRFEGVFWQSLQSKLSLEALCVDILRWAGIQPMQPASAQLLRVMSQRPLLIVLEDIEALLQPNAIAGDYQAAFQPYGEFFQSAAKTHSCVVITGTEGPAELVRQGGDGQRQNVRSLILDRLSEAAAIELLQAELTAVAIPTDYPDDYFNHRPNLIARCQGHPSALKAAARVIREIFNSELAAFSSQSSVLVTDVLRLLTPSFERLSQAEVNVLSWLATQDEPLSLEKLQNTLPLSLGSADLISVLDSLKQRSLLCIDVQSESPTFYLPALVKAYAIRQLMRRFSEGSVDAIAQVGDYHTTAGVIDLSPPTAKAVQLSQWRQGQFDPDWQPLNLLFEASVHPTIRLQNAYHLQAETFVKRYRTINLSTDPESAEAIAPTQNAPDNASHIETQAVLLVALHQEAENLYRICVQAQPSQDTSVLPATLSLNLLNAQQSTLAAVTAREGDTFIQLPYFRGMVAEPFTVQIILGDRHHTETFVI